MHTYVRTYTHTADKSDLWEQVKAHTVTARSRQVKTDPECDGT